MDKEDRSVAHLVEGLKHNKESKCNKRSWVRICPYFKIFEIYLHIYLNPRFSRASIENQNHILLFKFFQHSIIWNFFNSAWSNCTHWRARFLTGKIRSALKALIIWKWIIIGNIWGGEWFLILLLLLMRCPIGPCLKPLLGRYCNKEQKECQWNLHIWWKLAFQSRSQK